MNGGYCDGRGALGGGLRCITLDAGQTGQRPRPVKRKRTAGDSAKAVGLAVAGFGAVAYAVGTDSEAKAFVDDVLQSASHAFEDFNDSSREFFEGCGDCLVAGKSAPWLLDLATMKYPEYIPTLVLDLDKVILKLEHNSKQGWHVVKRPYADQFFKEISLYYEIVIFSDDVFPLALDIATKWNIPVTGVLHRDFCSRKRSHYVKDISKLGRRLDRTLIIDHDPAAFQLQPENGILIREFDGDTGDSELLDLLDFLKAAATSSNANEDIRKFVEQFGGGDEDLGKRYLLYKQGQDSKVANRRKFGRTIAGKGAGFPAGPPGANAFPR